MHFPALSFIDIWQGIVPFKRLRFEEHAWGKDLHKALKKQNERKCHLLRVSPDAIQDVSNILVNEGMLPSGLTEPARRVFSFAFWMYIFICLRASWDTTHLINQFLVPVIGLKGNDNQPRVHFE